ncbi:MAG: hypothetical protein ABIQ31_06355 [Ferruginibacter sp.]
MKYTIPILLLVIITGMSCNEQKKTTEPGASSDTAKAAEMKIMIPSSACYSTMTGKDTVLLKVEVFPNVVTGKITYKLFEKDSNKGDFDGHLHGDTLLADYKFMSEGKLSTRQVIFLIKGDTATEGYGDMEEKDRVMIFKDVKQVSFGKGIILKKSDCGEY